MAKCLYNGLNYPFYTVSAWKWVEDSHNEKCGEYELFTLLETESKEEAMAKMNSVKISANLIEVILELDTGEDVEWIGTRDEYGYYDT